MVSQIYPAELQLNKANSSDTEAPFLDLNLSITNGIVILMLKKRRGYCNRLRPSVRPSVSLSVMLSPPKPLVEIQPNLVCKLLK